MAYWITLEEFLERKKPVLRRGDYIYQHHNEECPQRPSDASKLFFVVGIDENIVKVHSYANEKKDVVLKNLQGHHWWILELPPPLRKQLGLD